MKMKKHYLAYLGLLAVFMIVGTFLDLTIAKPIFNLESTFATASEHLTPIVLSVVLAIGAACLFFGNSFKKGAASVIKIIITCILALLSLGLGGLLSFGYGGIISAIFTVAVFVVASIFIAKLPAEEKVQCQKAGFAIFFTVAASMLIVESVKIQWGRVRFRSMNGNYDLFTPWYQINGMKYKDFVPKDRKSVV